MEYTTGITSTAMPSASSLPALIKTRKDRARQEVRLYQHDKMQAMCALTNIIVEDGVRLSDNERVVHVSHRSSYIRNLTDDPKLLRTVFSQDAETEG